MGAPVNLRERESDDDQVLALDGVELHRAVGPAGRLQLAGHLAIPRDAGRTARFAIEVNYPDTDPRELPTVLDPDGRFPPDPERHVEADGTFCLWLPECAPARAFAQPLGLAMLLSRVQEFLELQCQYETRRALGVTPAFPGRALGHGEAGRREWLDDQLARLGRDRLLRLVRAADPARPIQDASRCPCGSGRSVAVCHRRMLTSMRAAWAANPDARATVLHRLGGHS